MSNPGNPLANFRTYTYHHILTICDNVKTAATAAQNTNISQYLNTSTSNLTDSDVSTVNNKDGSTGKYVLLINSLKDARYSIDNLKWESVTGQISDDNIDNYTSMATEGSITIIEPLGLRFLNEVQNAYKLLNSDPTACVWMIKTIFVGYSGTNNVPEYITNINPLIFNVVDLTSDFTVEGGVYNIGFVNINNGSGKLPQLMNVTETIKLNLSKNPTLKDTILNKLAAKIQDNSLKYFESVKQKIEDLGMVPKLVVYEFFLDKHYLNDEYVIDDSQPQNKTEGTASDGAHLDFSKSITIENAIKNIMRHCPQVKRDAIGKDGKEKYGYKIRSILNSDNNVHKISYYIQRYRLIFSDIFEAASSENQEVKAAIEKNTIEFDYMYTGKNTDIIDFSMKMDLGIVFFQTLISSNNLGTNDDLSNANIKTSAQSANGTAADVKDVGRTKRKKPILPIFFSTKIKNTDINNSKNPKESTEFQALLNRHAAIENLNSKLKIHGNPTLLNSINKTPGSYGTDITQNIKQFNAEADALPYWESVPALAKVNIFMPTDATNNVTGKEKFWYDGLFYILGVINEFNDGLFTQELEMISIPNTESDAEHTKDKTIKSNPVSPNKIISNTDGSKTITNSEGSSLVKVKPYVPPSKNISTDSIKNRLNNIATLNR